MEYQKPDFSFNFDDEGGTTVDKTSPDLHELTKKVMKSMSNAPVMEGLPDTFIELPGGYVHEGEVHRIAEVQELTGEHEEKLAKAQSSGNPAKYLQTLLQCGTVAIGEIKATPKVLEDLLQGDIDTIILGIRKATFGDEFELINLECPHCKESNDIILDLNDIPFNKLENPEEEIIIDLRKGRKVKLQFPTNAVQNEIFKKPLSLPEMNSLTLAHCIISFFDADGNEKPANGLLDVKKLGIADRNTIQEYIYTNQPGPRYDKVTANCHSCEEEIAVPLNVTLLFRELGI